MTYESFIESVAVFKHHLYKYYSTNKQKSHHSTCFLYGRYLAGAQASMFCVCALKYSRTGSNAADDKMNRTKMRPDRAGPVPNGSCRRLEVCVCRNGDLAERVLMTVQLCVRMMWSGRIHYLLRNSAVPGTHGDSTLHGLHGSGSVHFNSPNQSNTFQLLLRLTQFGIECLCV